MWGMDLVGPLPTAQGNCKFAAVVIDYFTKWVEAKALAILQHLQSRYFSGKT
jgi:hypothetical protein